mgnify:CR=1 FL=1
MKTFRVGKSIKRGSTDYKRRGLMEEFGLWLHSWLLNKMVA